MNMVKVKTSDLIGAALDWAVAQTEGYAGIGTALVCRTCKFSSDWALAGPLIDKYSVSIRSELKDRKHAELWIDRGDDVDYGCGSGPTHLIAVCRAVVSAKLGGLGGFVEVPAELVEVAK